MDLLGSEAGIHRENAFFPNASSLSPSGPEKTQGEVELASLDIAFPFPGCQLAGQWARPGQSAESRHSRVLEATICIPGLSSYFGILAEFFDISS